MDQEIIDYILQAQKHGLADLEIKQNLLNVGWDANMVEQSFVYAKAAETHSGGDTAPPLQQNGLSQKSAPARHPATFTNTHTTVVNGGQFPQNSTSGRPFYKNKLFWIVLILLAVLGGSAFGYYNFIYATPQKVFSKFLATKQPAIFQSDYSLSYSYTDASSSQPIVLNINGTAYQDNQNPGGVQMSNAQTLALKSPTGNGSVNLQYIFLNKILYVDISQISQLQSLGANWVKLDLGQLQSLSNQHSATSTQTLQNFLSNPELKTKLQNLIDSAKIFSLDNSLTKETVKGVAVYHLKAEMDSQALAATALSAIDLVQNDPGFTGQKITDAQRTEISSLLKKLTLKQGDLWIGQKDGLLYQINLSLSVPSVQDLSNPGFMNSVPALNQSLEKKRDATRLSDSMKLEQALQLYYNDHGGYPAGVMGVPQELIPTYIAAWPVAPTPLDGTCTDYFNGYWYKNKGTEFTKNGLQLYPSFTLTFCLGQATGGYDAGIGMVTPQGMAGNVACPATLALCVNSNGAAASQNLQSEIDNLAFNSTLTFNDTFSNFGKSETLQPPENPLDLMQILQGFFGTMSGTGSTTPSQMY